MNETMRDTFRAATRVLTEGDDYGTWSLRRQDVKRALRADLLEVGVDMQWEPSEKYTEWAAFYDAIGRAVSAAIERGHSMILYEEGKGSSGYYNIHRCTRCQHEVVVRVRFYASVLEPRRIDICGNALETNCPTQQDLDQQGYEQEEAAAKAVYAVADNIFAYELGELDYEETLDLFIHLFNRGYLEKLQGHYGRTFVALVNAEALAIHEGEAMRFVDVLALQDEEPF